MTRWPHPSVILFSESQATFIHKRATGGGDRQIDSSQMKTSLLLFCVLLAGLPVSSPAQQAPAPAGTTSAAEQAVLTLSRDKWRWMAERNVDALGALFHDEAVFVHMGATMSRTQELDVIRSGSIVYKSAEIQEASVRIIGTTAILLNRIRLIAVVGGNEVVNPFVVTEVYVQQGGNWKLGSLSFTRLLTP